MKDRTLYSIILIIAIACLALAFFKQNRDANLSEYAATCKAQGLEIRELPNGGIHCGPL